MNFFSFIFFFPKNIVASYWLNLSYPSQSLCRPKMKYFGLRAFSARRARRYAVSHLCCRFSVYVNRRENVFSYVQSRRHIAFVGIEMSMRCRVTSFKNVIHGVTLNGRDVTLFAYWVNF